MPGAPRIAAVLRVPGDGNEAADLVHRPAEPGPVCGGCRTFVTTPGRRRAAPHPSIQVDIRALGREDGGS